MKIHRSDSLPASGAKWIWLILLWSTLLIPAQAQIVINEIMADNKTIAPLPNSPDYFPDYVELYNNSDTPIDLGMSGWRIGDSGTNFAFTAGTIIQPRTNLLVFCDSDTTAGGVHTGFGLSATKGDGVYLYLGLSVMDSQTFGIQAPDYSIGRIPDVTGAFQLNIPTPGETNASVVLGTPFVLKINEWLATNSLGPDKDWFEIYNPSSNAVTLTGLVFADRGASNNNLVPFLRSTPPLSFIAPFGWAQIFASDKANDADEVDFSLSSANGDELWIFASNSLTGVIDHVSFSGGQVRNTSEGRLPDGGDYVDGSGNNLRLRNLSPADSNFGPIPEIVINEALAHVDPPLEDAIELYNPNSTNVNIGGWWLSNNRNVPKKFQIPLGTIVPAGGFRVFYEYEFNGSNPDPFNLNSAHGGEVYLFKANANGDLLGFRRGIDFGASQNGVSFGRWVNSQTNTDIVPMAALSFGSSITAGDVPSAGNITAFRSGQGALNPYPMVGPVVISEIHYHPPDIISGGTTNDNSTDEYVELHNITSQQVPLYDPVNYVYQGDNYADGRTNTWRLRGGISFNFPEDIVLQPNGYILVVNFDPADGTAVSSFTNLFSIPGYPTTVRIVGPYKGKLSNGGATVTLYKPDPPQGPPLHNDERGFVPYIHVDMIKYNDKAPWPVSADGLGQTLQRRVAIDYGNDPANWKGALPTAGRANTAGSPAAPNITTDPAPQAVPAGGSASFTVVATGTELSYRWTYNGIQIDGATNATLQLNNVATNLAGNYRAVVVNPVGIDYSAPAALTVVQNSDDSTPPTVTITAPANNARLTDPVVNVSGTAKDNVGLAYVEVQLNSGEFLPATGTTVWSREFNLVPGTNTIRARSTDVATNHSVVVTRVVNYVVTDTLNLSTNGQGGVSGATSRTILEVGKNYTIVAKPAAGYVFSNWTGDVSGVSPSLTFTMAEDLDVIANFVPNPFNTVQGNFNGLFGETSPRPESSGYFSLKVTSKGTHTLQLLLGGKKYSGKGTLDLVGHSTVAITRPGLSNLSLDLQVALDGSDTVTGTITDGTWNGTLYGYRQVNSAAVPSPYVGRYTFVVPGTLGSPDSPEGDTFASMQITTSGQATIVGLLADNTKFTQKTTVSKSGEVLFYAGPYFGRGVVSGWMMLNGPPVSQFPGSMTWIKPSTAGGVFYPGGFTNSTPLTGSSYTPPTVSTPTLSLPDGLLTLAGGNLAESIENGVALGNGGKVTNTGPHKLTLKFTAGTGLFNGSLVPTNSTVPIKFTGAVLQSTNVGAGFVLGTNKTGRVTIEAAP